VRHFQTNAEYEQTYDSLSQVRGISLSCQATVCPSLPPVVFEASDFPAPDEAALHWRSHSADQTVS
jgi:hypothetical protein